MLQHTETTAPAPGLLACVAETRIGPSAVFGETRTEPLAFLTPTSHRASADSWPEIASDLGLYSQPDPIGLEGGLNLFGYALGNPVRRTDTDGLRACESGACADCPSGVWISAEVSASAFWFYGKKVGYVTYYCVGRALACSFSYSCKHNVGYGYDLSASAGAGVVFGGGNADCTCAEDLGGRSGAAEGGWGPIVGGRVGAVSGGGRCVGIGAGVGVGPSGHVRANNCTATFKNCYRF